MSARVVVEPPTLLTAWAPQVDFILSSLAASHVGGDRRRRVRLEHRVLARLRLYAMDAADQPLLLFTRDVEPRSAGFITQHPLPLGYGGRVKLPGPQGDGLDVGCVVYRCRPCARGWWEGALSFNRTQQEFATSSVLTTSRS